MNVILDGDFKGRYGSFGGQENGLIRIASSRRNHRLRRTKNEFIVGLLLDIISNRTSFGIILVMTMER